MPHSNSIPPPYCHLPAEWSFLEPLAAGLGFAGIGVARAGKVSKERALGHDRFIASGFNAGMDYLARNREQRFDLGHPGIVEHASTVVVAALPYGKGTIETGFWNHVAAYARGVDYHRTVRTKLDLVAGEIRKVFKGSSCRVFVDTAPLMERTWALAAGVGVLGKNGQVMVPGWGSKVVLGEVVCGWVPSPDQVELAGPFELCQGCSKCIESCPTGALVSPAVIDARRCLSYWTIENRTEEIPDQIASRASMFFGCDVCTSLCPSEEFSNRSALESLPFACEKNVPLSDISKIDDKTLLELVEGTPLERTGSWALKRNARMLATLIK